MHVPDRRHGRDKSGWMHGKALAIQQKLADANPSITQFQLDLALSHINIGYCLHQAGKPAEALAAFERRAGDLCRSWPTPTPT